MKRNLHSIEQLPSGFPLKHSSQYTNPLPRTESPAILTGDRTSLYASVRDSPFKCHLQIFKFFVPGWLGFLPGMQTDTTKYPQKYPSNYSIYKAHSSIQTRELLLSHEEQVSLKTLEPLGTACYLTVMFEAPFTAILIASKRQPKPLFHWFLI